jgi:hypothetical protein
MGEESQPCVVDFLLCSTCLTGLKMSKNVANNGKFTSDGTTTDARKFLLVQSVRLTHFGTFIYVLVRLGTFDT